LPVVIGVAKFSVWKIEALRVLALLEASAPGEEERRELSSLIERLYATRYRELPSFILHLRNYCRRYGRWEVCRELLKEEVKED